MEGIWFELTIIVLLMLANGFFAESSLEAQPKIHPLEWFP